MTPHFSNQLKPPMVLFILISATLLLCQSCMNHQNYEFDCQKFSLRIAFQGGDPHNEVGTFSIENALARVVNIPADNKSVHQPQHGGLYKKCPNQ